MPYVTTRLKPRQKEIDIMDFLNGLVTVDMLQPPTRYQNTGTRTFYYDYIDLSKLRKYDIPRQIEALQQFYQKYQHLDICNGDPKYNYELQIDTIRKLKKQGIPEIELEEKCAEFLEAKGFGYNPLYKTFFIPKSSSTPGHTKWRRIDAPHQELKDCLSNLKQLFELMMDGCYYHTSAFAYIHNRSAKDAVSKHANNKSNWFLKIDFSNFFGSTTPEFVMRMLSDIFPFSEIVRYEEGAEALKNCLNLCFLDGGLPQGTPMSPILTNIMMIPIDHQISNTLSKQMVVSPKGRECSYTYTRYADDIIVSNKLNFNHRKVVEYVKRVLEHYNAPFTLNDRKTRYGSNAGENWMLGLMLNQEHKPTVGHKRKKQLKAMLTNYMLDRQAGNVWMLEDIYHLQGEISYCRSIEPETIDHIIAQYSRKYGDIKAAIKADIKAAS